MYNLAPRLKIVTWPVAWTVHCLWHLMDIGIVHYCVALFRFYVHSSPSFFFAPCWKILFVLRLIEVPLVNIYVHVRLYDDVNTQALKKLRDKQLLFRRDISWLCKCRHFFFHSREAAILICAKLRNVPNRLERSGILYALTYFRVKEFSVLFAQWITYLVRFSQQETNISVDSINWLSFVMEKRCVLCGV